MIKAQTKWFTTCTFYFFSNSASVCWFFFSRNLDKKSMKVLLCSCDQRFSIEETVLNVENTLPQDLLYVSEQKCNETITRISDTVIDPWFQEHCSRTTAPQVHFVLTQFKWMTHKVVMLSSLNWKTRCIIIKYIGHILYVLIASVQVGASQSTAPTINNSMTDEDSNVRTCGNLLSGMKRGFFLVCSRFVIEKWPWPENRADALCSKSKMVNACVFLINLLLISTHTFCITFVLLSFD